ncbi:NAD(P)-dependent dehydrogenase (short-subunit alcohol dehydrogenase family) [Sphingobium xenophagum]|uniref:NAD(P)-dependent dehydrogenase (Short-subunit alcohol dehydrogenase family) n=1 Tax=Sphingobium xenophagum TaxID=121428 RepID=A0ABU1X4F4_SPHXE|nr:NAD(P)-dependent dehydrogenase (short-subunit alcohol dehydrogenase family) [Sphingobium xenophagum]
MIAVARDPERLSALVGECEGEVIPVAGSVGDDASALALAKAVAGHQPVLDAVITSVNAPPELAHVMTQPIEDLVELFRHNVMSHLIAAKAFLPLLAPTGHYIGLGGGMADVMVERKGGVSMCQAALRNLFRHIALENAGRGPTVKELMLYSLIVDPADEANADPRQVRADEVGDHIMAIVNQPDIFPGPILALKSRKQVGQPQRDI